VVWLAEECMANGAPLERYIVHAESIGDRELASLFGRALIESRRVRPDDPGRFSRGVRGERRRR
jgi:hypothetical protein